MEDIMPFSDGKTISCWGVVRFSPWHLADMYDGKAEANAKALEMGPDYVVRWGENREGTDDFIWTGEGLKDA